MNSPNMLMLSWVAGALPTSRHQALLSSAGSVGYSALRQSLTSTAYPQHTIILTNTDIRNLPPQPTPSSHSPPEGPPYSIITRLPDYLYACDIQRLLNTPVYYYPSNRTLQHNPTQDDRHTSKTSVFYGAGGPLCLDQRERGIPLQLVDTRTHLFLLSNVVELPTTFLCNCTGLQVVNLDGMPCIERFDPLCCEEKKQYRFAGFGTAIEMTSHFMPGCSGILKTIDLTPLARVTNLPRGFLEGCTGLEEIDLSPIINITSVAENFMKGCTGIKTLNCTPLRNITKMPVGFLSDCIGLEELDLTTFVSGSISSSGDTRAVFVPDEFLNNLRNLKTIKLPPSLAINIQTTTAPTTTTTTTTRKSGTDAPPKPLESFMNNCFMLDTIDISPLRTLTIIGKGFLKGCKSLKTLDLTPLANVSKLGPSFLQDCSGLRQLDISALSNVLTFQVSFLEGCSSLESIHFDGLPELTFIYSSFLKDCISLTSIDMRPLRDVSYIDKAFLQGCTGLTHIDFPRSHKGKVKVVQTDFLEGCVSLNHDDLDTSNLVFSTF